MLKQKSLIFILWSDNHQKKCIKQVSAKPFSKNSETKTEKKNLFEN